MVGSIGQGRTRRAWCGAVVVIGAEDTGTTPPAPERGGCGRVGGIALQDVPADRLLPADQRGLSAHGPAGRGEGQGLRGRLAQECDDAVDQLDPLIRLLHEPTRHPARAWAAST